jgi:hypothetical protein
MRTIQHSAGGGTIFRCLAALILLALFSGCGFAEYGAWERSLLIPAKAMDSPGYACPTGYHLIPCPTCYRQTYRTEISCRGGRNCEETRVPYIMYKNPCAFCQGSPYMCEPDGAVKP